MNLLFFVLFAVGIFACSLIGYKKFFSTTLYALAIGGVVNSNFFNSLNFPIDIFGLPFGIDSIIYTLFTYCVILMYLRNGKKQAYYLSVSSVVAIVLSAVFELAANLLHGNISEVAIWNKLFIFLFSAIASIISILACIDLLHIFERKRKRNEYLLMTSGILIATLLNTLIYFPLSGLVTNLSEYNIGLLLLTSFIGKGIALLCALLMLFLLRLIDKFRLKKEKKQEQEKLN